MTKANSLLNQVLHINVLLADDLSPTKLRALKNLIGQNLPRGSVVTASKSDISSSRANKPKKR